MLRGGQHASKQLRSAYRPPLKGALLALFFVLGPFLRHSAPLAAFLIAVERFLCVLDRSGLDFEVFRERLGSPWALFFQVFLRVWMDAGLFFAFAPNTQKPRKNYGFLHNLFLLKFEISATLFHLLHYFLEKSYFFATSSWNACLH